MIESMRAFGYSLETAIADLVDNSISADSKNIYVDFAWNGAQSTIVTSDDGAGMGADDLTNAMRLGSQSPREERAPNDLGRFGLGMKTAVFSQGRVLAVASKTSQGGQAEFRSWDLDHVGRVKSWSLLLEPVESDLVAVDRISALESGTSVLIRELDKTLGKDSKVDDTKAEDHFLLLAERVERHLSMVFHRFIEDGVHIYVNGNPVESWDPFLPKNTSTQILQAESLPLDGERVVVSPFIVPHHSRLSVENHSKLAGPNGWNLHQGFYIYRARRLLVPGGWLGLGMQSEEHYKLARIRVDLTNSMDLAWQIDVRKAAARTPQSLREDMQRISRATRSKASDAYRYRGKSLARSSNTDRKFVWTSGTKRGKVQFKIDRKHPIVAEAIREGGKDVQRVLRLVEETVPVQAILIDSRENPDGDRTPYEGSSKELERMLRSAFTAMTDHGMSPEAAFKRLLMMEPFDAHPELVQIFKEEYDQKSN